MYLTLLLGIGILSLAFGNNSQHKFWGIVLCSTATVGFLRPPLSFNVESLLINFILLLLHLVLLVLSPVQILLLGSGPPVADGDAQNVEGIVVHYLPPFDDCGKDDITLECVTPSELS